MNDHSPPPRKQGKTLMVRLRGLPHSKSLQAAVGFGAGGVAFALANLLLARYLTPLDFALFALILALKEFGLGLGGAGVELVINRRKLAPTGRLAARIGLTGTMSAVLITGFALMAYELPAVLASLLFLLVICSTLNHSSAAFFQSAERFTGSLAVIQSHNFLLLALVPIGLMFDRLRLDFVISVVTAGYLVVAALGWLAARERLSGNTEVVPESVLRKEGLGALGIGLVVLIMWQAERLVIPLALTMEDLATFGVLAAVVSAPFRMIQLGIGYTILPRLRAATSPHAARRLIASELRVSALMCFGGTAAILLFGPWLIDLLVGDKYDVGLELFVAAIVVGYLRIWQGVAVASVTAVASTRVLGMLNRAGWVALAIGILGAFGLSEFGLPGVIYGVGLGWLSQAAVATMLAIRAFQQRWQEQPAVAVVGSQ
jgi:O-antigen/teichoic acid export membrane protein